MNKVFALSIFCLTALSAFSQPLPFKSDAFHYDATFPLLLSSNLTSTGPSNGHQLSFMQSVNFSKNSGWGMGYGLGFAFYNTYNNLGITKSYSGNASHTQIHLLTDSAFTTNKQNTSYLDLPVEFRYGSKPDSRGRRFRLQLGVRPGVRLSGSTYLRKDEFAVRYYRISEMNRWHIPAYARIGYGQWSLYASYDLLPYFISGEFTVSDNGTSVQEPLNNIHLLQVGISLTY